MGGCHPYIGDLIVGSDRSEEQLTRLHEAFNRLSPTKLTFLS